MKLIFGKMTMHNFMVFENEQFDFAARDGMTMIRGKNNDSPDETNGTGKSTIGYALLYALFGETQSIEKNEYLVCRSSKDKNMKVTLEFQSDGVDYRLDRGLDRGKLSYFNIYKLVDGNEHDITKSTIAETQKYLEAEILMCDISIFLRTMLLTANQTYNFYMLKKQDKKDFIEKLFDISSFGEMYKAIHKDILQLDKNAMSKQSQLMVLNRNVADYTRRRDEFDEQRTTKLANLDKMLNESILQRDNFAGMHVDVNLQAVEKFENAIEKLDQAVQENRMKLKDDEQTMSKIDIARTKMETVIEQRNQTLEKHSAVAQKLCTDCVKIFNEHYSLDQARNDIDSARAKISALDGKRKTVQTSINDHQNKISLYSDKITAARKKIRELTAESDSARQKLNTLEQNIKSIEYNKQQIETSSNPYTALLEEAISQVKTETAAANEIVGKIEYLRFAENIVSQDTLRKFIIKDLIGILNNRIRKYLIKLGAKYYVVFDENMEYTFVPTVGKCGFGNFSGGEKMRLMIATSFAFRDFMSIRNGLNSNILILDEYFDSAISTAGVLNLMEILKEYRDQNGQNIFVITHRPEVSPDSFDNVIQVEKTHDIGHISYLE